MARISSGNIAMRILMLAGIGILGLLLVSAIFIGQRSIEQRYRDASLDISAEKGRFVALGTAVHEARELEQNFLLSKDITYSSQFHATLGKAMATLSDIGQVAPSSQADQLAQLLQALKDYDTSVSGLVKVGQELGLNPDSGLEGTMRNSVHSIEAQVEKVASPELMVSMLMMRRHEKDFIMRGDAKYIAKHDEEATRFIALVKTAFPPGAKRMRVMDALDVYRNAFRFYSDAALKEVEARKASLSAYMAIGPILASTLEELDAGDTIAIKASDEASRLALKIAAGMLALVAAALLIGVLLIGRSITRPVQALTEAMRKLASGETGFVVPGLGLRNEFGSMAGALDVFRNAAIAARQMEQDAAEARERSQRERAELQAESDRLARQRLLEATGGMAAAVRELAQGNLAVDLDQQFSEDFESLRLDLKHAFKQLGAAMAQISETGDLIDAGTQSIADSTDELARRTEVQAASLEETAAALDQITANVTQSVARAQEARQSARKADQDAKQTSVIVGQAVEAMGRIEETSGRISNIISLIDGMAFQTNLLALNAGVEAARAGDSGRGFAVVAQEVRELAGRSAAAAREIKDLLEHSHREIKTGAKLVRETGAALTGIAEGIGSISQDVEAIADGSREQALGLKEVNDAVNLMDQSTQQNAAMVQENNTAGAMLKNQAAMLRDLLSQFHFKREPDDHALMRDDYAA